MLGCGRAPLNVSKFATSDPPHSAASHSGENRGWRMGFWSLIVTQFQNAFNDNAIKFLVIYLIVEMNFPKHVRDRFVWIVSALFAVPFVLFSLTGGYRSEEHTSEL